MIRLEVRYEDGQTSLCDFDLPLMIGRHKECQFVIRSWRVAKWHMRLEQKESGVFLEDMGALTGTMLNGQRVFSYGPLQVGDEIIIGPCLFYVKGVGKLSALPGISQTNELNRTETECQRAEGGLSDEQSLSEVLFQEKKKLVRQSPATANVEQSTVEQSIREANLALELSRTPSNLVPAGTVADSIQTSYRGEATVSLSDSTQGVSAERMALEIYHRQRLHAGLLEGLDLRRINISAMSDEVLRAEVKAILDKLLLADMQISPELDRQMLKQAVLNEAVGLGPLEPLLKDKSISEIMVNRFDEIYIEKEGRLQRCDAYLVVKKPF